MINTTKELVFMQTAKELHASVISALLDASKWVLEAYGLEHINLAMVTTKTHIEAAMPHYLATSILKDNRVKFDEQYVKDVFTFINTEIGHCEPELYSTITKTSPEAYRKAFLPPLRRAFSVFLVSLHIRSAIVLPFSFQWPRGLDLGHKGVVLGRRELCPLQQLPELLCFIRSVYYREGAQQADDVFNTYTSKQRERLLWMGQRIIVAAGWLELSDVNYDDMLALKKANDETRFSGHPDLGLLMLADLFERKYGSSSPVTAAGWRDSLNSYKPKRALSGLEGGLTDGQNDLIEQAAAIRSMLMAPDALESIENVPGLQFDLKANSKIWISVERTFLRKVRHKNKNHLIASIGHLNTYLFGYLPYWYAENPGFQFEFPSSPEKLTAGVFVSNLGLLEGQSHPIAFVDYLERVARYRNWEPASHYSVLKQVEKLFEFIELHNTYLPSCSGFRQSLHPHDYPALTRATVTNKRPIQRRIFKLFLAYVESLLTLSEVLLERVASGEVSSDQLTGFDTSRPTIDCFARQDVLGFIPMVFHQGKAYRIERIPNIFNLEARKLNNGVTTRIPHPHALHQILVALYTGLRHNHIQWLDAETFDQFVNATHGLEFAKLFVNTDKSKTKPWTPYVNFRVIEILRKQRAWRTRIDEAGFVNRVPYNNNKESRWGTILPLFSYYADGSPHSDALYSTCWFRLLAGLQTLLGTVGEHGITLFRFLPPSVKYGAENIEELLQEYGASESRICKLEIKSDITPHSTRVSVVSHAITILSADLIGRHWTGQTEATIYHYVVLDEEEMHVEQQRQNLALRQKGYDSGYEAMLSPSNSKNPHIKADNINSNLSRSLKENFDDAILSYGCISLSFSEELKSGLDVLRETRTVGAIQNKTEICPYGNQCPPEVVSSLKGWRRCGPCHLAVRSIDHLPAITAKIRQVLEGLYEVESRIAGAEREGDFTADELDSLEKTRDVLAEDLVSWQMAAEVLEVMRQRISAGESTKAWHVRKPEIIERDLKRVLFPTNSTEYILARLQECEAFPALESPQIRAKFDLLRRHLLANTGNIRAAFSSEPSVNPAAECRGLLRSIMAAQGLTLDDLKEMLESSVTPHPTVGQLGMMLTGDA